MTTPSGERYSVALQGFSAFERGTLSSFFRLAGQRSPSYVEGSRLDRCDFIIANADQAVSLAAVQAAGRTRDTVFVGATEAPPGAMAWLPRPIHPMHILRELDSLVEQRNSAPGELRAALASIDLAPPASAPGRLDADMAPSGPAVLVVDDSATARRFLQERLQQLGYRVQLANDGDEAIALLESRRFALVFLDIVLGEPGSLDGLALCQHLKQHPEVSGEPRAKLIIVTALTGPTDQVRGALAGCDVYLTKPVAEDTLLRTLQRLDPAWMERTPKARAP